MGYAFCYRLPHHTTGVAGSRPVRRRVTASPRPNHQCMLKVTCFSSSCLVRVGVSYMVNLPWCGENERGTWSDSAATLCARLVCGLSEKEIGRVGFEPTCARGTADFKSAASAVSPPPQGGKDGEIIPKKSGIRQVMLFPLFRCKKLFSKFVIYLYCNYLQQKHFP